MKRFPRLNRLNKLKLKKPGKIFFSVAMGLFLAVAAGFYLSSVTAAPVDILNDSGSFDDSTQVGAWTLVNTTGTSTWTLDTTNFQSGTGSALLQSPTGQSVPFEAYSYYRFTTTKLPLSATLDLAYRKDAAITPGAWNITAEIWKVGGTAPLETVPVDATTANTTGFVAIPTQNLTSITEMNTQYEIRLKVQGTTGNDPQANLMTNFDSVKLNITYDETPPAVASAVAVKDNVVNVTFNEAVDKTTAETLGNYTISPTMTVTGATLQTDGKTVQLTTGTKQTNGTVYTVSAGNVKDLSGNSAPAEGSATFTGIFTNPLKVLSARANSNQSVIVQFNQPVDSASATAVVNYKTTPALTVTSANIIDSSNVQLVTSDVQASGTTYTVAVTGVKDTGGNLIDSTANTATFTGSSLPIGQSPHGSYKSTANGTFKCAYCHNTHNGTSAGISTDISENNLCISCHNGSSGPTATGFPGQYEHMYSDKKATCSGCHDPHKSPTDSPGQLLSDTYNPDAQQVDPTQFQLCFDCHSTQPKTGFSGSSYDIYQYYNNPINGTQAAANKGHYIASATGTYHFSDGTTQVPQNFQLRCTDCHDKHGSGNKYQLKTTLGTDTTNQITLNDSSSTGLTVAEERTFCTGCHNGTNRLYFANDQPIPWDPNASPGHTNTSVKCSSCHGGSQNQASPAIGAHAPS